MKAACSALKPHASSTVPTCTRVKQGRCRPGGHGDAACKSVANVDKRTSKCVDVDTDLGYDCQCDAGMHAVPRSHSHAYL